MLISEGDFSKVKKIGQIAQSLSAWSKGGPEELEKFFKYNKDRGMRSLDFMANTLFWVQDDLLKEMSEWNEMYDKLFEKIFRKEHARDLRRSKSRYGLLDSLKVLLSRNKEDE